MNKRGLALILSFFVVVIFYVLMNSFFVRATTENKLVRRKVEEIRAFWTAEAGIADGRARLPDNTSDFTSCIGDGTACYSVTVTPLNATVYEMDSVATVTLPNGATISRTISAVVKGADVDPSKFQYAIQTSVDLEIIGSSVDINPETSQAEESSFSFTDLFGYTKEALKANATHLYINPSANVSPCDNITWIQVPSGTEFSISSSTWQGSGVLIIEGNANITGGTFNGIIYVIGRLRMSGNPVITGTVVAESDAELVEDTRVSGNVTLNYNLGVIATALTPLSLLSPEIVSWREL